MASPYILTNVDIQALSSAGQDFQLYVAFLNPIAITTNWVDISIDAQGNWLPPSNVDTFNLKLPPYTPTANLGPNRIGFVGEPLYFDGTRSCQRFDLPVVAYSWSVTGLLAQEILYDNSSQIGCTWSSPGLYTVSLTVTDTYGAQATGTRQVMIYNSRAESLPGVISISGLSGSLANTGWQCELTTVNSQVTLFPPDLLPIGTYQPIVVLCETRYEVVPDQWQNMTVGPHGSFSPGYPYRDPRILFDGYIQNGTIHQDVDKDTLAFVCQGPQMILSEAKTHQTGYYNATYRTATSLNTNPAGAGYLVAGLTTSDVMQSLLQYHTTVAQHHDVHIWNSNVPAYVYTPTTTAGNAIYNLVYTTLSLNEGTIAQNMSDLAVNEWSQFYCERDGAICVGPQINYRGSDYWQQPTLAGPSSANFLINFAQDLGYTVGSDLSQIGANFPTLPAQPMPIRLVHPWGNQPVPPQVTTSFAAGDSAIAATQQGLNGPPLLCVFSDTPVYDTGDAPGSDVSSTIDPILPWITANWPQDLAIYPVAFDFPQNYTGKTSLVKLIGTLYGQTTLWSSWWPQDAFNVVGVGSGGAGSLVTSVLPSGNWIVDQSHVLPDVTTTTQKVLMDNYWWEMARRVYYAGNVNYTGSVTLTMFTGCSLGDIVGVTRQQNALGAHWTQKPFYVTDITYSIDMTQRTWSTALGISEVTSILMGPITLPPVGLPVGFY